MPDGPDPLRFHPRFTHLVDWGESVSLLTDGGATVLEDRVAVAVARAVDGTRDEFGLVAAVGDLDAEHLHFALIVMEERGVLVRSGAGDPEPAPPEGSVDPLADAWRDGAPMAVLEANEVGLGGVGDARLVLVDDFLAPEVTGVDREAARAGTPYLVARLGRRDVAVGPYVVPGETACWACVRPRLWDNLPARRVLHEEGHVRPRAIRPLPHDVTPSLLGLAAILRRARPEVDFRDVIVVHDVGDGGVTRHALLRRPQCAACGDPTLAPAAELVSLRQRVKHVNLGTGYRTVAPSETLRRLRPLVSRLTGVVRSVDRVDTGLGHVVHVYTAGHSSPIADTLPSSLKAHAIDASGGKGATAEEAEASALCEAIERQTATLRGDEPVVLGAQDALAGPALPPGSLLHFSKRQHAERDEWNRNASSFQWVPAPYRPSVEIHWTRARALGSGAAVWVPAGYVYLGVPRPDAEYIRGDSNGLAAGNCLEEAVLQGFLELVERDAVALWWYNRTRHPEVDLDGVPDRGYVPRIRETYRRVGRTLCVLDVTSDLEIPCYVAVSALERDGTDLVFGFGAHLDPTVALRRALAELCQILPAVLRPLEEREERLLPDFADAIRWWQNATLETEPYLSASGEPVSIDRWQRPTTGDLGADIEHCLSRVRAIRSDILVHDMSRPDFRLKVVRVIVPELRHFWRRLGPGRLYEVPVRLGRLPGPLPEAELNPLPLFV